MSDDLKRYRLSVDLDEELYFRLDKVIPYGLKRTIFYGITEDVVNMLENCSKEAREKFFGLIACRLLDTTTIMSTTKEARND